MIANKYVLRTGTGKSHTNRLPSFDRALIEAGVGNYNLVRLSSILPAGCKRVEEIDLPEGSLLPTAYATISSDHKGDVLVSGVCVGLPEDEDKVGVIMEYSAINSSVAQVGSVLKQMVNEAFLIRGWKLKDIEMVCSCDMVENQGETVTTFACLAEW